DETKPDWMVGDGKDDGDRRGCSLGREGRDGAFGRGDHGNLSAHQFTGQRRQPIILTVRPAVFDCDVLALDMARLLQPLSKRAQTLPVVLERCGAEEADHRECRLLRARRKRPRRRTAEQRDEFAPLHSITSSARASSVGGTSRPIAFAVLRLMTNSYLVGACTGRSAGFSPLRMRSTYLAARRYWSVGSTP